MAKFYTYDDVKYFIDNKLTTVGIQNKWHRQIWDKNGIFKIATAEDFEDDVSQVCLFLDHSFPYDLIVSDTEFKVRDHSIENAEWIDLSGDWIFYLCVTNQAYLDEMFIGDLSAMERM